MFRAAEHKIEEARVPRSIVDPPSQARTIYLQNPDSMTKIDSDFFPSFPSLATEHNSHLYRGGKVKLESTGHGTCSHS